LHELSIALSILEIAEEEAERQGGRVTVIRVRLGPLSGVVPEALVSAYELASENTPMANSLLHIEVVPLVAYCPACREEVSILSMLELCCPDCGSPTPKLIHGQELEVVALEIAP
jgi:hydrogenase nickel incorporation protein HypA/HybF